MIKRVKFVFLNDSVLILKREKCFFPQNFLLVSTLLTQKSIMCDNEQ